MGLVCPNLSKPQIILQSSLIDPRLLDPNPYSSRSIQSTPESNMVLSSSTLPRVPETVDDQSYLSLSARQSESSCLLKLCNQTRKWSHSLGVWTSVRLILLTFLCTLLSLTLPIQKTSSLSPILNRFSSPILILMSNNNYPLTRARSLSFNPSSRHQLPRPNHRTSSYPTLQHRAQSFQSSDLPTYLLLSLLSPCHLLLGHVHQVEERLRPLSLSLIPSSPLRAFVQQVSGYVDQLKIDLFKTHDFNLDPRTRALPPDSPLSLDHLIASHTRAPLSLTHDPLPLSIIVPPLIARSNLSLPSRTRISPFPLSAFGPSILSSLNVDLNSIALDIFQGQLITCAVILIFVIVFLLREWMLQNTPPADVMHEDEDPLPHITSQTVA